VVPPRCSRASAAAASYNASPGGTLFWVRQQSVAGLLVGTVVVSLLVLK
jgi:hypothetical protein